MSELGKLIEDMVERLLSDYVDHSLLEAAESGVWLQELWAILEENGLVSMLAATKDQGAKMNWREAFLVVTAAGRHGLPLPLPESIAAGWLLATSGLEAPDGRVGLASGDGLRLHDGRSGWTAAGRLSRVPWGRYLSHVVVSVVHEGEGTVVLLPVDGCQVIERANLVGEPRDDLVLGGQVVEVAPCRSGFGADISRQLGALLRSAQMAGAISTILDRALTYAGERQQFGRLIGNFQAVQHMLAVLSEESAAATMAAEQAFVALDARRDHDFAIAVAKIRTGEAAGRAAAIAHQVLGAMGFAREHPLHTSTRRLWAWRAEFGCESDWAERIADTVIPIGSAGLWTFVTAAQSDHA
jgi:acyl-CoA dehydrogenase